MRRTLLFALLLAIAPAVDAAELAGVTLPDSQEVGGKQLVLNGLGLREATMLKVDVYVAGLYLESKSSDAAAILSSDGPARLQMQFVRDVGADSMTKAWSDGFKKNAKNAKALVPKVAELNGWMTDVASGDTMSFTYVPGEGVTVAINGDAKGTIEGAEFAQGLWSVWLGKKPPNKGLKEGLLGR